MRTKISAGYNIIYKWFASKNLAPFAFQEETWKQILQGNSGLVNAPTGCGKTFSVFMGALIHFINNNPDNYASKKNNGLQLLWITPLRALAKDIGRAMEEVIDELGMQWKVAIRNGDTEISERQKQKRNMPEVLIITPESLHLLLAQKGYREIFKALKTIAVDEWHELLGSKRGVQVGLAISRIIRVAGERAMENNELSTGNGQQATGNTETQSIKNKTQNSELRTQKPELKTKTSVANVRKKIPTVCRRFTKSNIRSRRLVGLSGTAPPQASSVLTSFLIPQF